MFSNYFKFKLNRVPMSTEQYHDHMVLRVATKAHFPTRGMVLKPGSCYFLERLVQAPVGGWLPHPDSDGPREGLPFPVPLPYQQPLIYDYQASRNVNVEEGQDHTTGGTAGGPPRDVPESEPVPPPPSDNYRSKRSSEPRTATEKIEVHFLL